jgi:hypothetical protein
MRVAPVLILLVFTVVLLAPLSGAFAAITIGGADAVWNDVSPQAAEPDDIARGFAGFPSSFDVRPVPMTETSRVPGLFFADFWRPPRNA